jgi:outer membrane protein OmpA-like peptidoglycan-associated protein
MLSAKLSVWRECALRRHAVPPLVLALVICAGLPVPLRAQVRADTVGVRSGDIGVHGLVGAFVGRLDLPGDPVEIGGLRAGIGFGEVVQLVGFYWRSIDTAEREFLADHAFGGEARFALNTGFGIAPFIAVGLGRLSMEDGDARTAAIGGAGLQLPLGPVLLSAAAHDYILGVGGLDDRDTEDVSHNWLFSAGLTIGLGRTRRAEPVVVQRPPVVEPVPVAPPVEERVEVADRVGVRNYQSDRTIEVPIPLEGSITLRYGPEAAAAAAAAVQVDTAAARATVARDIVGDPVLEVWLRQLVGAEVAAQLATRGTPLQPGSPVIVPFGTDPAGQRALENAFAGMLRRMEAYDVQRTNMLRNELRQLVTREFDVVRAELDRIEQRLSGAAVDPPVAVAPPPVRPPVPPNADPAPAVPSPVTPSEAIARAAMADAERLRADAALRLAMTDVAARHPGVLSTLESERGPAVVVADVAFATGASIPDNRARIALDDVAVLLLDYPDRRVYVHGHTDSVGQETSNQLLSELRAETVRSLLVRAGIESTRVHAVGYGEGHPIADNRSAAGRALNRRVEIVVGEPYDLPSLTAVRQESAR